MSDSGAFSGYQGLTGDEPGPAASGGGGAFSGYQGIGGGAAASSDASTAAAKPASKGGGGGFFSRVLGDVKQIANPKNIERIAGAVGSDVHNAADMVAGHLTPLASGDVAGAAQGADVPQHLRAQPGEDFIHFAARTAPFTGGLLAGGQQTGAHALGVTQAIPIDLTLGHAAPLGKGYIQRLGADYANHPVASLLNDAVNASMAGGAAAGALRAAGAEDAANVVGSAAHAAGKVAALPFKPIELAGGALKDSALGAATGEAMSRAREALVNSKIGQSVADRALRAASQAVYNPFETERRFIPTRNTDVQLMREAKAISKVVPDQTERGAAVLNAQGVFDRPGAAETVSNALADPEIRQRMADFLDERNKGIPDRAKLTVPIVETAVQHRLGLLGEDAAGRVSAGEQWVRGLDSPERTALAKAQGVGAESFQGPQPKQGVVTDLTQKQREAVLKASDPIQRARAQVALDKAVSAAEDSLKAAPAPYRPGLQHFRDFVGDFTREGHDRLLSGDITGAAKFGQVAQDFEQFGKLTSFEEGAGFEKPAHVIGANRSELRRLGGLQKGGYAGESGPGSVRETTPGAMKVRSGNLTALDFEGQAKLNANRYAQYYRSRFANEIVQKFGTTPAFKLGFDTAREMNGRQLYAAMHEEGYVPWEPRQGTIRDDAAVNAGTYFVPKGIADLADDRVIKAFKPSPLGIAHDAMTRWLYKAPLQLSPFYMAHRIGTAAMTLATEGMSPADIVRYGSQAAKMVAKDELPGALQRSAIDFEDRTAGSKAYHVLSTPARVIDEMTRTMVYLKNLNEGAPSEVAIRQAIGALGNLNKLGPVEQATIRRIFPVYPWLKQVSQMVGHLAVDHPLAAAFTLNAGEQAAAKGENGLPAWAQGFDPLRIFSVAPLGLVNPIERGAAALGGIKLTPVPHALSAPAGEKAKAGGKAYAALNTLPVGKMLLQSPLSGLTPGLSRYDTGELKLDKHGKPEPSRVPSALSQFLTGGGGLKPLTPEQVARQAKAQKTRDKGLLKRSREIARLKSEGTS